jgi:hypothetical protein
MRWFVAEIREFDGNTNLISRAKWSLQPIPEIFDPESSAAVRERGVEDQAQCHQQVRLPRLVLSYDNSVSTEVHLHMIEVSKIFDYDARNPHWVIGVVGEQFSGREENVT